MLKVPIDNIPSARTPEEISAMTTQEVVERCVQIVLERQDNRHVTAWAIRREFGLTNEEHPASAGSLLRRLKP